MAVVLIREPGVVSSSFSSPRLAGPWWPRGSQVQRDGPLASALERDHTAAKDVYRSGLAFKEQFCAWMATSAIMAGVTAASDAFVELADAMAARSLLHLLLAQGATYRPQSIQGSSFVGHAYSTEGRSDLQLDCFTRSASRRLREQ